MALVKRGNCEYTIADHLVEEYLAKGYSLLDEKGKVIREKTPVNLEDFKLQNAELKSKVAALEAENAAMKAQLAEANAENPPEDKKLEKNEKPSKNTTEKPKA